MVATERRDSHQELGCGWAGLFLHRTTPQTALSLVKVGRRGMREDPTGRGSGRPHRSLAALIPGTSGRSSGCLRLAASTTPPVCRLPGASPEAGTPSLANEPGLRPHPCQAGHGYLMRKEDPRDLRLGTPDSMEVWLSCLLGAPVLAGPKARSLLCVK